MPEPDDEGTEPTPDGDETPTEIYQGMTAAKAAALVGKQVR